MDCSMPIMNGYDATEKIRQFQRTYKLQQPLIIACTGHTEQEYIKKAWCHQMDEIVPKPAQTDLMKNILLEVIDYKLE